RPLVSKGRGGVTPPLLSFEHVALDGYTRLTCIRFDPAPARLTEEGAWYEVELPGRGTLRIGLQIAARPREGSVGPAPAVHVDVDELERERRAEYRALAAGRTRIETDHPVGGSVLSRAFADLQTLRSRSPQGDYIAGGVPWFAALFGRDSIITAFQLLPY